MKLLIISLLFISAFLFQSAASACTYFGNGPPKKTVSQLYNGSEIVARGRVLYIDDRNLETTQFDRVARLEITELFKSPKKWTQTDIVETSPETVDIHYKFVGGRLSFDCGPPVGTHFMTGQEYLIFAKRNNADTLYVTHTSGEYGLDYHYDEQQISNFLQKDQDSELKTTYCYRSLRQSYAENIFTGKFFESESASCLYDFDREFYKTSNKNRTKP